MCQRAAARRRVAALSLALLAAPAGADLWGYVDEQGRPHVAAEKLDDRYRLFYKGRTSADVAPPVPAVDQAFAQTAIYRRVVDHPNVARFEPLIARHARRHGVDAALVKAVVAAESAFEPDAVSPKGALGLMQVIPDTAERYGIAGDRKRTVAQKLLDPAINVDVGTRRNGAAPVTSDRGEHDRAVVRLRVGGVPFVDEQIGEHRVEHRCSTAPEADAEPTEANTLSWRVVSS